MDLTFALDELLATGWSCLDSAGCTYGPDGRAFPTVGRVQQEFAAAGFELSLTKVAKFDCFRAEWRETGAAGLHSDSVVSRSETDAAVYALAQFRRSQAATLVGV